MLLGLMGPLFISQLFDIDMDGTARRAAISSNQEAHKTITKWITKVEVCWMLLVVGQSEVAFQSSHIARTIETQLHFASYSLTVMESI